MFNIEILAQQAKIKSTIFFLIGKDGIISKRKNNKIMREVLNFMLLPVFILKYNGIVFEIAVS